MDEELIKRWNSIISKTDTVYHMGDFTLGDDAGVYLSRLHGKIKFVVPDFHHDKRWLENRPDLPNVEYFPPVITRKLNGVCIVMCHYPFAVWDKMHYGAWHLYGHVHRKDFVLPGFAMNVGVDHHDFYPVYFDEIKSHMISMGWTSEWKAPWII